MTDLRAPCEVRTGALTTLERLSMHLKGVAAIRTLVVDDAVRPLVEPRWSGDGVSTVAPSACRVEAPCLLLNGRCILPPEALRSLRPGEGLRDASSGHVIGACVDEEEAASEIVRGHAPEGVAWRDDDSGALAAFPWEIIARRDRALAIDLASRKLAMAEVNPPGVTTIGETGIHVAPDAAIFPGVVLDASAGSIVIEAGAVIRPGAIVCGPCWIGPRVTILDRALIKAGAAIGPWCKVAGEVGGTIFQGYANKAHDGHLGDSWVGEWVNFGAGTTNSNLLNTYGEVTMYGEHDERRRRTGLQFLGCIVGDHVKFAIGTRIMTGSVFGTGAMVAMSTPPPALVQRFAWLTDDGATRYRFARFVEVARAVMARRGIELSDACLQRLTTLYDEGEA